jgi:hypothetical protein
MLPAAGIVCKGTRRPAEGGVENDGTVMKGKVI